MNKPPFPMQLFSLLMALMVSMALTACTSTGGIGTHTVTLLADGETRVLTTEALTVQDVLAEADVLLDENDRVEPVELTLIEDGMTIRVVRVETYTEVEQREIPFERRTVRDASIPANETRLLEPGITGVEELVYRITTEDGTEVERQLVRRVVTQEPRDEIILVGVQAEQEVTPISGTIAYAANRNAWVIQTVSPNQRRLTHDSSLDGRVFALSPDGGYLLFTRVPTDTGGTDTGEQDSDGNEDIPFNTLWVVETAAVDARPVPVTVQNVLWADWEPNCRVDAVTTGCRIAYTTGSPVTGNPGWKGENDLWIGRLRVRDGHLFSIRQIVPPSAGGAYGWWGTTYAWSPDGRMLAYARADTIGLVRVRDGVQTELTSFPPYRTYAPWVWVPTISWSPEGAFIITTLHGPPPTDQNPEDSPVFDVWALASDGSLGAELVSEAGMWAVPRYAPTGDLVAFGHARSPYVSQTSGYDLYVMDRDGSGRRRLFPPEGELGLDYPEVAWGPGGDRFVAIYQGNLYLLTQGEEKWEAHLLTESGNVTTTRWGW